MTLLKSCAAASVQGVAVGQTPDVFSEIHSIGTAAAIWDRKPLARFQNWIDALNPDQFPRARVVLRSDAVPYALTEILDASNIDDGAERRMLSDDISALADMFATVMRAQYLRLRLDVINTNACRKFHIDAITARLICTYRGTGTQYGIKSAGGGPTDIHTAKTGVPLILRGTGWPVAASSGLLHRSPPIEGSGETRFVLVLDPVAEMEAF